MLTLLIGFDQRDSALKQIGAPDAPTDKLARVLTQVLGRVLVRLAIFVAIVAALTVSIQQNLLLGGIALATLILVTSIPYLNIVGHVMVAAAAGQEYQKILSKVRSDIATAARMADNVTVVAHSQGGFVVHEILSSEKIAEVDQFVGVGSGLKPITLLRRLQCARHLVLQWLVLVTFLGFYISGILWNHLWRVDLGYQTPRYILAVAGLNFLVGVPDDPLGDIQVPALSGLLSWGSVWILGSLVACYLGLRLAVRLLAGEPQVEIQPVRGDVHWREISSYQDVVGRALLPPLPDGCSESSVPVVANPFLDHVSYFKKGSLTARIVAGGIVANPAQAATTDYRGVAADVDSRFRRGTRLRTWLIAALAAIFTLPFAGTPNLTDEMVLLLGIVYFSLLMVVTAPISMVVQWVIRTKAQERARLGLARQAEPPTAHHIPRRMAVGAVIVSAIFTGASAHALQSAGFEAASRNVWGVSFATLVTGICVGVGYWNRLLLGLAALVAWQVALILTAPPVIPAAPYPLGQAGFLLSIVCVLTLLVLVLHANRLVRDRFTRIGGSVSSFLKRILGIVPRRMNLDGA